MIFEAGWFSKRCVRVGENGECGRMDPSTEVVSDPAEFGCCTPDPLYFRCPT